MLKGLKLEPTDKETDDPTKRQANICNCHNLFQSSSDQITQNDSSRSIQNTSHMLLTLALDNIPYLLLHEICSVQKVPRRYREGTEGKWNRNYG